VGQKRPICRWVYGHLFTHLKRCGFVVEPHDRERNAG
jgi:hypothetical protein